MENDNRIGGNLQQLRKSRGFTQAQLADICTELSGTAFTEAMISTWERGISGIPVRKLCVLSSALECTADRIINCLPPEAIEDAQVIVETIARLTPHNRQAIHWIFCHWDGNINALIELMLAHCGLRGTYRAETAGMALHQYQQAAAAGAIDPTAPDPDLAIIAAAWEEIAEYNTWI